MKTKYQMGNKAMIDGYIGTIINIREFKPGVNIYQIQYSYPGGWGGKWVKEENIKLAA